jgi:hypothetical protein
MSVRGAVHDVDSELPVVEFKTQTEQIAETLVQERLFASRLTVSIDFFRVLGVKPALGRDFTGICEHTYESTEVPDGRQPPQCGDAIYPCLARLRFTEC